MPKTTTTKSLSLSEAAINSLANEQNQSLIVNQMLEALYENRTALSIIETEMRVVSYKKLVELGVDALKAEALRYKNLRAFADLQKEAEPVKPPRGTAIKNNIDRVSTWEELNNLLVADGYDFSDLNSNRFHSYANHQYYYQSATVERATSGEYYVNKVGAIVAA
jgi:hypothetical protein